MCDEINDETLNEVFSFVKAKYQNCQEFREGFAVLRKAITLLVNDCKDNAEVTINTRGGIPDPVVVKAGNGENKLSIIIVCKDDVVYEWKRRTWTKIFWDIVNEAKKTAIFVLRSVTKPLIGYAGYQRILDRD